MPQDLQTLKKIKGLLFPLATEQDEQQFKAFTLAVFEGKLKTLDINDYAGILILSGDNASSTQKVVNILLNILSANNFQKLISLLLLHDCEKFYEDKSTFQRANSITSELLKGVSNTCHKNFFDQFIYHNIQPLISDICIQLEANIYFEWNASFDTKLIQYFKRMLDFIYQPENIELLHPLIRYNCYLLYTNLHLYSPYPMAKGDLNNFSNIHKYSDDAIDLEYKILTAVGGYFFLRYLSPMIAIFPTQESFASILANMDLTQIKNNLKKLNKENFQKIAQEMKTKFKHKHLEKLVNYSGDDYHNPSLDKYITTLVKFWIQHKIQEIMINGISTPLQKMSNSLDPKVQLKHYTKADLAHWNQTLLKFFNRESTTRSPYFDKLIRFIYKLTEKITIDLSNEPLSQTRTMIRNFYEKPTQVDKRIVELVTQNTYQEWLPNHPFFYATRALNYDKVLFLIKDSKVNLLRGIETIQRLITVPTATIQFELRDLKKDTGPVSVVTDTEFSEIPLYLDTFDCRTPRHTLTQILLTLVNALTLIEQKLYKNEIPLAEVLPVALTPYNSLKNITHYHHEEPQNIARQIINCLQHLTTPNETKEIVEEIDKGKQPLQAEIPLQKDTPSNDVGKNIAAKAFEQIKTLILKNMLHETSVQPEAPKSTPPRPSKVQSAIRWSFQPKRNIDQDPNFAKKFPFLDFFKLLELTLNHIWLGNEQPLQEQSEHHDQTIFLTLDQHIICEISLDQLLDVILDLFVQQLPLLDISADTFTRTFHRMYAVHQHDTKMHILVNEQQLSDKLSSCLQLNCTRKNISKEAINAPDIIYTIISLFRANDIHQLKILRQRMEGQSADILVEETTRILNLPRTKAPDNSRNTRAVKIQDLLLTTLIRTSIPQHSFTEQYIQGVKVYDSDFIRVLLACYHLRQCLFPNETQDNAIREAQKRFYEHPDERFQEAVIYNIDIVMQLITTCVPNAIPTRSATQMTPDHWRHLYTLFKSCVTPLAPPLSLKTGIKLKRQPNFFAQAVEEKQDEHGAVQLVGLKELPSSDTDPVIEPVVRPSL